LLRAAEPLRTAAILILGGLGVLVVQFQNMNWVIFWTVIGWLGNVIFFSRFVVQWYATEKRKQVVVPVLFWWLSLAGSLLLLLYAVFYDKHHVIIFAYAFTWIPYIRNLIIHRRHKDAHTDCAGCGQKIPPQSNFCPNCGVKAA
jgi:lipid-A-disaccharide synthase-like uncharacterized protein